MSISSMSCPGYFSLACIAMLSHPFCFGHIGSTPGVGKVQNFAVVKRTLEEHASFLMRKLELRDLVAFVKATHFDFTVCKHLLTYHVLFMVMICRPLHYFLLIERVGY